MKKKILIADDEPNISEPLKDLLESQGYRVNVVPNGKKAFEAFRKALEKEPYALIMLDIVMPQMSGLEALAAIRNYENKLQTVPEERVPVIMLSGLGDTWPQDAFATGASDYVVKPYDTKFLIRKIEKMLGKAAG